jgi:ParB family chromosome partitioning protein
MEEAQGFRALLDLEEPKYSIEQIAAKTGKSPVYVASRLKLTELSQNVVDAFYREEIGVGHALLLAKLQHDQQEQALSACFREDWSGASKNRRILLPVRNLQQWIEQNVMLILKDAPFNKRDAQLVPAAGSCVDCPKRTGHNKLLFSDLGKQDACTDPILTPIATALVNLLIVQRQTQNKAVSRKVAIYTLLQIIAGIAALVVQSRFTGRFWCQRRLCQ